MTSTATLRGVVAAVLLATTLGCESGPTAPTVALNETFELAPGEVRAIDTTGMSVGFIGAFNDSRCPINAVCVRAGDATVQIRVRQGRGTFDYEVHDGDGGSRDVRHQAFLIRLMGLQPLPFAGFPTPPGDYRATFQVTK